MRKHCTRMNESFVSGAKTCPITIVISANVVITRVYSYLVYTQPPIYRACAKVYDFQGPLI